MTLLGILLLSNFDQEVQLWVCVTNIYQIKQRIVAFQEYFRKDLFTRKFYKNCRELKETNYRRPHIYKALLFNHIVI